MFRRFLVPSDGSAAAEHALAPALDLVHRTHATLDLTMVRDSPARKATAALETGGAEDEGEGSYLAGLSARILAAEGVRARFTLLKGQPAESIHAYVHVHGIDLVAMGLRGAGWQPESATERTDTIGRTAEQLARSLDVPILFVPPQAPTRPLDHVLVAIDGSTQAAAALASAGVLLFQTAHATLVRVVPPSADPTPAAGPDAYRSPGADLDRLADGVRAAWRSVASRVVRGTDTTLEILRAARETETGALIMSAAGHGGSSEEPLVMEILRRADLPVLLFPSRRRPPGRIQDADLPGVRPTRLQD